MSRRGRGIALVAILISVLAAPSPAADTDAAIRDLESLIFLAKKHDRLWSWVNDRIAAAKEGVDDTASLTSLHYGFILSWAESRSRREDADRVRDLVAIYERAFELGLPDAGIAEARDGLVDVSLAEAKRLLDTGDDMAAAEVHVDRVLALRDRGLTPAAREEALNLGFEIKSFEANRYLEAGDYTKGYDRLKEVVEIYGDQPLAAVQDARNRLAELDRTTGVLSVSLFDAEAVLARAEAEVVGASILMPGVARIHRRRDDFTVEDEAVAEVSLRKNEPTRVRLLTRDVEHFAIRVAFRDGKRPELRLPLDLSRGARSLELPDRVPARMAFVPASGSGPGYFIGLYEVTNGEYDWYRRKSGQRVPRATKPDWPVTDLDWKDVQRFLRTTGLSFASLREWRQAAVGTDGRPMPWGGKPPARAIRDRANLLVDGVGGHTIESAVSRATDLSPYGLHHVLGNVWELIEGGYVMGGSTDTPHPLKLDYLPAGGGAGLSWYPDLLRDPRPLAPAEKGLDGEMKRKWKEVLYDDEGVAPVTQSGVGLRVVLRIDGR